MYQGIAFAVIFSWLTYCMCLNQVTIDTDLGQIVGIEETFNGEILISFFGVPYAEPPERFKKPVPVRPWSEQKTAMSSGKYCPHKESEYLTQQLPGLEFSEDCLYVDIHIPKAISLTQSRAVVVFFVGSDDFETGMSLSLQSTILSNDIISVVVSSRVGILGFLSTGDDVIPGNFGLWDQQLAVTWINKNIAAFGGDPQNITLHGVKTGAISVGFQAAYPKNAGKFQRIIAHMTFSTSMESLVSNAAGVAQSIAKNLCPPQNLGFDSQQIYECLVNMPVDQLIAASTDVLSQSRPTFGSAIGPVIDNDFISETVELLPVDMYFSVTVNEGYRALYFLGTKIKSKYNIDLEQGVPKTVVCDFIISELVDQFYPSETGSDLKNLVCNMYTKADHLEQSVAAVDVIGDILSYSPIIRTLNEHAGTDPANKRYLSLVSSSIGQLGGNQFAWLPNAVSGECMILLSLGDMIRENGFNFPPEVVSTSDKYVEAFGRFVKTGNPNPPDTDESATSYWPVYTKADPRYMHITGNHSWKVEERMFNERMHFWMETVPSFIRNNTKTNIATDGRTTTPVGRTTLKVIVYPSNTGGISYIRIPHSYFLQFSFCFVISIFANIF